MRSAHTIEENWDARIRPTASSLIGLPFGSASLPLALDPAFKIVEVPDSGAFELLVREGLVSLLDLLGLLMTSLISSATPHAYTQLPT